MSILENAQEIAEQDRRKIMSPGIAVYRIDYDMMKNGQAQNWSANIAAYSPDEAQNYLRWLVGDVNIKSVGMETRLDAITNELRQTIVEGSKRKPGRPKKA